MIVYLDDYAVLLLERFEESEELCTSAQRYQVGFPEEDPYWATDPDFTIHAELYNHLLFCTQHRIGHTVLRLTYQTEFRRGKDVQICREVLRAYRNSK